MGRNRIFYICPWKCCQSLPICCPLQLCFSRGILTTLSESEAQMWLLPTKSSPNCQLFQQPGTLLSAPRSLACAPFAPLSGGLNVGWIIHASRLPVHLRLQEPAPCYSNQVSLQCSRLQAQEQEEGLHQVLQEVAE